MLAPRRRCLDYSNFYCYVRKRWPLAWDQTDILRITYSILYILILKSVLVFFTFTHASFDDTDFIIARL